MKGIAARVVIGLAADNETFTVDGIEFTTDPRTACDAGTRRFADLETGMRVEVECGYRDGRHIAVDVERED